MQKEPAASTKVMKQNDGKVVEKKVRTRAKSSAIKPSKDEMVEESKSEAKKGGKKETSPAKST